MFTNMNVIRGAFKFKINLIDLDSNSQIDCSKLKDYESIGSYCWSLQSTSNEPVILVPGKASRLVDDWEKKKGTQI